MTPTRTAHAPDILLTYPVGSVVVWKRTLWNGYYQFIPGLVLGKVARQGNARLSIRVLYVGTNPFRENVLYTQDKTSVGVAHIMSLDTWRALRPTI